MKFEYFISETGNSGGYHFKLNLLARHQWLMSVILATQEAEIRRIVVQRQPG
jgi:hypothetical protein